MGEGAVICPNCGQTVVPVATGGPGPSCPQCYVQFAPARSLPPVQVTSARPAGVQAALVTAPALKLDSAPPGATAGAAAKADAREARRKRSAMGPWEIVKIVLGGAAGLGIGYLVVFWIQNRQPALKAKPRPQPRQVAARAPTSDKFPEFRSLPETFPSAPTFVPPVIGFNPSDPAVAEPAASAFPMGSSAATDQRQEKERNSPPPARTVQKQELEGLPTALKLPALVDTAAAVLCPLHLPPGKTVDISLNAVAANVPAEATLLIEPNAGAAASWLFSYAPNVNDAAQDKRPLAELKHVGGELVFTWRSPIDDADARKELANCVLRMTCGSTAKTTVLRVPLELPQVRVDLARDITTIALPVLDPPKEDSLRLEIVELKGFPTGAAMREGKQLLKLKERGTIEFAHMQGAEMQLEFRRHPTEGLQLVIRPEFRENAAEKTIMTLPRLVELKKDLEKLIPQSEAKLVALGKEARALSDQLQDLGGRPAGGPAFVAWQSKRTRLESALSSARSQASRLSRRLPEMKARLAAVPQVQQFLTSIHTQGSLVVRVVAECGDARLAVIDARLAPSAPAQSP